MGNLVYERVTPTWDSGSTILMRWYNDRALTQDAPQPMSTSYIDVIYKGTTYEGEEFDSSFENTAHGDSIYRSKLSDNIKGWVIAFTNMRMPMVRNSVKIMMKSRNVVCTDAALTLDTAALTGNNPSITHG